MILSVIAYDPKSKRTYVYPFSEFEVMFALEMMVKFQEKLKAPATVVMTNSPGNIYFH